MPTLPLASLTTSFLALLFLTYRMNRALLGIDDLMQVFVRVVFLVVSVSFRLLSLAFLWLYFDRKCLFIFLIIVVLNFVVAYTKEVRRKKYLDPDFSIWANSLIGLFVPSWFLNKSSLGSQEHLETVRKIRSQTVFGNAAIILSLGICYLLVNQSAFRYHNNIFDNASFNFACLALTIMGSVLLLSSLVNHYAAEHRGVGVVVSVLLLLTPLVCHLLHVTLSSPRSSLTLRVQHQDKTGELTTLQLSSLKTMFLNPVKREVEGPTVQCTNLTNATTTASPVLVLDLQEDSCLSLLGNDLLSEENLSKDLQAVLVLEAWRHLSSSPFPKSYAGQSLEALHQIQSVPVLSARRLPDVLRSRFSNPSFVTSDLSSSLTVDCASIPCVNRSGPLRLSKDSGGLVRMVEVEQESHIEGSDQFSLKRVPTSRRTEEVACRGGLQGRNLSNLFCSGVKTWWAEDKLSNYRCCHGNVAVFSSPRCNNQEVGTWSGWSSWGECVQEVGASQVEQRQRRFKVAVGTTSTWKQVEQEMEEEECLWVAREGRTCGEGEALPRGGCSIPDVVNSVPVC